MRKKSDIKCKVHKGVKVCTVSTPRGRQLSFSSPINATPQVTIKFFTSEDCSWCKKGENKLKNITGGMKDIVDIVKIDVDSVDFTNENSPRIDLLPTIQIGNKLITGDFDDDQVWRGIFDAYQMA